MHFELYAPDPAATRKFYEAVFGWRFEPIPGAGYTMAKPPGGPEGGLLKRPANIELPPLLTYLAVADADETARRVTTEGGKVIKRYDVPGVGKFCLFEAPGGIVQGAWAPA